MCVLYLCTVTPWGGPPLQRPGTVHGTEETVNAGPLSWLVMEGCSDSSLEASIASVRQKQTDCVDGDATIWKPLSCRLCFVLETY